jgi:chemotaxis protein MotA
MFSIIGIVLVFACVIGGYLMEKGKLGVLVQPAELVTIGGAAIGTVLAANPLHILKKLVGGLLGVIKGSPFTKQRYVDTLKMMFDLFAKSRKEGAIAIESDVEDPEKSPIFSRYPAFLGDHHARDFVCDTMRMAITGGVNPFDVDQMMELDMDSHHHSESQPNQALTSVADALPGLGIVAAVLGVVVTMGSLGGPPEEIGHKVAAALVGTDDVPIHNAQFASNWDLSAARAMAVAMMLVNESGVDPQRMSIAGYGQYHPAAGNDTPEGRRANRRVDIVVVSGSTPAAAPVKALVRPSP